MKSNNCKTATSVHWIMRIILSVIFLSASYSKFAILGVDNFAKGMSLPIAIGWLIPLGEFGAGVGIIIGGLIAKIDPKALLTRASGTTITIIMIGAIFLVRLAGFKGGLIPGVQGMYTDLALLALGLYFAVIGNQCQSTCLFCSKK